MLEFLPDIIIRLDPFTLIPFQGKVIGNLADIRDPWIEYHV